MTNPLGTQYDVRLPSVLWFKLKAPTNNDLHTAQLKYFTIKYHMKRLFYLGA